MKNTLLTILAILAASIAFAQKPHLKDEKVYEIKSGIIEYQVDGMSKGTKTFWFDDYGRMQATRTITTTKMMGISTQDDRLDIRTHEWVYSIDMKTKTGTRTKLDVAMTPANDMVKDMTPAERKQFEESVKQSLNAREAGTGEVLGRTCIIMEVGNGGKVWGYKNVPLKTELNMGMIKAVETAVKFDENSSVPASKFEVPAGITITDQTRDMQDAMKMIMQGMGNEEDDE